MLHMSLKQLPLQQKNQVMRMTEFYQKKIERQYPLSVGIHNSYCCGPTGSNDNTFNDGGQQRQWFQSILHKIKRAFCNLKILYQ
jgi:hypothetical protein